MRKSKHPQQKIKMVLIDKINILNPRARNRKIFKAIMANIAEVGLKKPITITACKSGAAGKDYDLVCGQGRLEAFIAYGQTHIPAIVIDASEEQALIMSLIENLARRRHSALELLEGIGLLQKQEYNATQISKKTGLSYGYVHGLINLLKQGEERLIAGVESGRLSLAAAIQIADTPDENLQQVLQEAYEKNLLRGRNLIEARRYAEKRRLYGKAFKKGSGNRNTRQSRAESAQSFVKQFKRDVAHKEHMNFKAEKVSHNLALAEKALKDLFREKPFATLIKAEKLNDMPKCVAELLKEKGSSHAQAR